MSFITNWISDAINGIIYGILVFIPIAVLNGFSTIVDQFGSKKIMDQVLGIGQDAQGKIYIPPLFLAFAIISIASLAIIISWNMISAFVKKEDEMKIKIVSSIKNSCKAILIIITIPIFFLLMSYIIEGLREIIKFINSEKPNDGLGKMIWLLGFD